MYSIFSNGQAITLHQLIGKLCQADIILVGEYHNNVQGHKVEIELAQELLKHEPSTAIAMEMFERQYQPLVDLFLQDKMSAVCLEKATFASNWGGGEDTWADWYQPIVDLAKQYYPKGSRLIAANACRSYVKIANHQGYEPLEILKSQGNTLFELPDPSVDVRQYLKNLNEISSRGFGMPKVRSEGTQMAGAPAFSRPQGFIDAQQVWDATMANSVALAYQQHPKVMLFIGDFHIKQQGGTTQRIKHAVPDASVLTISIIPVEDINLWQAEHTGHANIVIYTK